MQCSVCGAENPEGDRFCSACGRPIAAAGAVATASAVGSPASAQGSFAVARPMSATPGGNGPLASGGPGSIFADFIAEWREILSSGGKVLNRVLLIVGIFVFSRREYHELT